MGLSECYSAASIQKKSTMPRVPRPLSLRFVERQAGIFLESGGQVPDLALLLVAVYQEHVNNALRRIQKNDASAQDYASPIARQAWQTGGADAG